MTKESKELILSTIQKNARINLSDLAIQLNLPEAEVEAFITKCEKDKTIQGYYTLIKPEALEGRSVRALISVSVQPENETGFDHIARKLSKFTEVTDVQLMSGNYDLLLTVVGASLHEVADFIATKLAPMNGISHHSTHFMLKKYKEAGFQLEDKDDYERLSVTP
ncbi:MAG: Lrp/AsnC family transcriptional regulator [Lentisphaeria bacterium]|nr:Lrp/AsnC family transcriptional regulator [Lentisphaeria bacterium]